MTGIVARNRRTAEIYIKLMGLDQEKCILIHEYNFYGLDLDIVYYVGENRTWVNIEERNSIFDYFHTHDIPVCRVVQFNQNRGW